MSVTYIPYLSVNYPGKSSCFSKVLFYRIKCVHFPILAHRRTFSPIMVKGSNFPSSSRCGRQDSECH